MNNLDFLPLQLGKMGIVLIIICTIAFTGCGHEVETVEGISTIQLNLDASLSNLSWSPDGNSIVALADEGFNQRSIIVIDADTGEHHTLVEYDERNLGEARGPSWSPDSQSLILYYPVERDASTMYLLQPDIVIVDAQTGELLQNVGDGSYAVWGKQQNKIIIIDGDAGQSGTEVPIRVLDLETNQTHVFGMARPDIASVYEILDVSSTGKIIYPTNDNRPIIALETGEQVGQAEVDFPRSPKWSPNGKMLAYIESHPENGTGIKLLTSDGSCPSTLLDTKATSLDWSPDGTKIVYSLGTGKQEQGKLYILDLTKGAGKELMDSLQACSALGRFSSIVQ